MREVIRRDNRRTSPAAANRIDQRLRERRTGITRVPGGADHVHAVRDWVTVHDGRRASILVAPDVPLVQIGDIGLPFVPFPGTLANPEAGTLFSWVHNNLWGTNFPQGEAIATTFRYVVAGFDVTDLDDLAAQSTDIALPNQTPRCPRSREISFTCGIQSASRSNVLGRVRQPLEHAESSVTVTVAPHGTTGLIVKPSSSH